MKITCSIVTYNSENEIPGVLSSFDKLEQIDIRIAVVDNHSSDNTVKVVKDNFPDVNVISLDKNYGYGTANNIVILNSDSDYHIVANPDITFDETEIYKMIDFMEHNTTVSLLVPKVLNPDGTEQFLPKRSPSIRYAIAGRFERFGGVFKKLRSEYTLKNENITHPVDVDYATGCFMLFRTEDVRIINGFDERYFLYSEDADIARSIKSVGRVVYVPDVHVTHEWKRQTMKSRKLFLIQISSLLKYFLKWGIKF